MNKSHLLSGLWVCLSILSLDVSAVIISTDWQSSGDNLITVDTANNLEWLDLTVTTSTSHDDVIAQMGSGGLYEGWSYATDVQLSGFFTAFGGSGAYVGPDPTHNTVFDNGLFAFWGVTNPMPTYDRSYFLKGVSSSPGSHDFGVILDFYDAGSSDAIDLTLSNLGDSSDEYFLGSALVRVPSIPVPPAVVLFASGLLGLFGVAKRKKS